MSSPKTSTALAPGEARELVSLLAIEEAAYADLLQLAQHQNRHLRRQDLEQLDTNAEQWRDRIPKAVTARKTRETFLLSLGERYGITRDDLSMSRLARSTLGQPGQDLRRALRTWELTTGEFMRQNSLNGQLAQYCLGLVEEEADILCRGMTGNNGCYDATGGEYKGACAGVIHRQA